MVQEKIKSFKDRVLSPYPPHIPRNKYAKYKSSRSKWIWPILLKPKNIPAPIIYNNFPKERVRGACLSREK